MSKRKREERDAQEQERVLRATESADSLNLNGDNMIVFESEEPATPAAEGSAKQQMK